MTDASNPQQTATATIVLSTDAPITTTGGSLPAATAGSSYTTSLPATGVAPLQWTITAGQLPSGLTLAADGSINGTPLAAGSTTFVASVVDAHGQTAAAAFSLTVNPGLGLTTDTALPNGTVGEPYAYSFTSTFNGGVTWSLILGTFPAGLTLSPSGALAGTPTTPATNSFMLQALARDQTARQVYTLTINAANTPTTPIPTIPTSSTQLATGDIGQPYAASLVANGGTQPYAWALTQGQLPSGVTLSPVGLLSGNPTEPGSFSFALTVTDANNQTGSALFTVIVRAPFGITSSDTVVSHVGSAFALQLTATGGTPPYVWSAGGPLPTGLTLSPSGLLSGKPTTAGSYSVTISVHDASSGTQSTTQPATKTLQLQINVVAGLAITSTTLPTATRNVLYSAVFSADGGTTPYTWTLGDGQLPPGLTLAGGGTLSGSPSAIGSYRFSILVTDATGQTATSSFAVTVTDPLLITTGSTLAVTLAKTVNIALNATGGTQPYSWSITTGTLPAGLTLSAAGIITGTLTSAATATVTISVRDSAAAPAIVSQVFTITAAGSLAISTSSLPTAYLGSPYTTTLQVSGGTATYSWSVSSGLLPQGFNLSAAGLLTGTPSTPGSYTFTVTVTDSTGQQASVALTCLIATLAVTTTSLPAGVAGSSYIATLDARGGIAPYSWSTVSAMPQGLLFTADGVLTGTPSAPFSGSLLFTVTDQANTKASATLPLTITAPASGHLQITGLPTQVAPTGQSVLAVGLDQPAPLDLTGQLTLQFTPDTVGRDDSTLVFVPANVRLLPFTISKASTTARFSQLPTLQAGTSAGLIILTASISTSPSSTGTSTARIPAFAPVITAAHVSERDSYTLTLELDGYSTTTEVSTAHFTFEGLAAQSGFTIDTKALFNSWYSSQSAANQGGTFQYKQSFDFTGDTTTLSSVSVTLTNAAGTTTPYKVTVQ